MPLKVRIEQQDIPADQRHLADQAVGLTVQDLYALKQSAPLISQVAPEMRAPQQTHITRGDRKSVV